MYKDVLIIVVAVVNGLCTSLELQAQGGTTHQIQAVVNGLNDQHLARAAGERLRTRPDVLMARFDANSRNMLIHVEPSSELNGTAINTLLVDLGMSIRCLQRSVVEEGQPFHHLDPALCQEAPPAR